MVKEARDIAVLINKAINSGDLLLISVIISRRDIHSCEIYDSHTFQLELHDQTLLNLRIDYGDHTFPIYNSRSTII